MAIFLEFFFWATYARKMSFTIFYNEKANFQAIKTRSLKNQKIYIFPKMAIFATSGNNPWFWSKNGNFSNILFLGNTGQEDVFYDIPERKNAFLGYKNKTFKKSKNWHFFKGVYPRFWSKNGPLSNIFFLGNIGQENVLYDILQRKSAF